MYNLALEISTEISCRSETSLVHKKSAKLSVVITTSQVLKGKSPIFLTKQLRIVSFKCFFYQQMVFPAMSKSKGNHLLVVAFLCILGS